MKKEWTIKNEPDEEIVTSLAKLINVNTHLAKILVQRGVHTYEEAKSFFRPTLDQLHDPFLMLNMDKAVNRLTEAIFNEEKIMIYGDYDVDGTTSVSLMYLFLKQFSNQFIIYIPDRYTEGYGISEQGINHAISQKVGLVIALDCGIRAVERAKQAKQAGIDLIICDHHIPGEELPEAFAILDPKQTNCKYPFKELSGCGVGFKLLEGFCKQNTVEKEKLYELLDILAVSIASDIVPIVGENRVLTHFGLKKLNKNPSKGLKSLIEISGRKPPLSISDVVFYLGPRINAAGRLTHAQDSVKLLIGEELSSNQSQAKLLHQQNQERKEFDQSITAEALAMIGENEESKTTVLYSENWHKGVIGIVASRCTEHYYRPTIILTKSEEGVATGSARSVKGFDICAALDGCSDLLIKYGGHKYAAGLSLEEKNIPIFQEKFEEVVANMITASQLIPKLEIDAEVPLSFVTFNAVNILSQIAPFGPQNMKPVFCTRNVVLQANPKIIKDKHIKGVISDESTDRKIEFIGFNMAEKLNEIQVNTPFDIAYQIDKNHYRGNTTIVLNLKDVLVK